MSTRAETAAITKSALMRVAGELLDEGGPQAVTLRAVGAGAGVSRGAPYGHFASKEDLLKELAINVWNTVADEAARLRSSPTADASTRLERAVMTLIDLSRRQPHRFTLMFNTPADDATATAAATRLEEQFIAIIADLVGEADARRHAALLMSSAFGIAGMERSGHLAEEKWKVTGDELVRILINAIALSARRSDN